jgi:hypothetical protein
LLRHHGEDNRQGCVAATIDRRRQLLSPSIEVGDRFYGCDKYLELLVL